VFLYETEEDPDDEDLTLGRLVRPRFRGDLAHLLAVYSHYRRPGSSFQSRVMYKYSVFGKEYECDRLQEGLFRIPVRFIAERRLEGYRVGQRVMVYVSPRDPAKAVLIRGAPIDAYLLFGAGLILLLVGWRIL
jgi:hypothetical protein